MYITPIFNRTENDVISLKQLAEDIKTVGWLNATQSQKDLWFSGTYDFLYALGELLITADLQELAVLEGSVKGAMNYADFNRIDGNIEFLNSILLSYGYNANCDLTNPTWSNSLIPTVTQLQRSQNNVIKLVDAFAKLTTTPTIIPSDTLTYLTANDLEKVIFDLNYLLEQAVQSFRYSGTFTSGEDFTL